MLLRSGEWQKKQAVWDWRSEGVPVLKMPQRPATVISVHAWASGQSAGVPSAAGRLVLSPIHLHKLGKVSYEALNCKERVIGLSCGLLCNSLSLDVASDYLIDNLLCKAKFKADWSS